LGEAVDLRPGMLPLRVAWLGRSACHRPRPRLLFRI